MNSRRSFDPAGVAFGLLLPLAAAVAGLILTKVWEPRLPDQIATHWSNSKPDGFGTPMSTAWIFALVTLLVGGGCCAVAAFAQALLLMRRCMLIIGLSVVGLLLWLQITILRAQLGLDSAHNVRLPSSAVGIGILLGFCVGVLGAALLRDHRHRVAAHARPAADLIRGEPVTVRDSAGFGRAGTALFAAVTLGLALLGCSIVDSMWPLATAIPVVVLIVSLMRFGVEAGEHGVRISNLGLYSIAIDLEEITGAKVHEHLSPFKDFGGWGLRTKGHGRYGIVTHTGPAVEVNAASGLSLTITTRKAVAMAGALNSWADSKRCDL